jgi:TRAP-type C4-dicarboxylate transport system permease small subunit
MLLRNLQRQPKRAIPIAITLIVTGLSILLIYFAWPTFSPSLPHIGTNWNDFFHGFLLGLAIALEVGGAVIAISATREPR